jgi:hypothetical protein
MAKAAPTHISAIVDRSGSMASMWSDTVGGFQTFLDEQKALEGKARFSLRVFDDQHDLVYENVKRAEATGIPDHIGPRNMTALLDAIGTHVTQLRAWLKDNPNFTQVVVVIMTDGVENASREFDLDQVRKMLAEAEADGWKFIFMGANIDAFGEANKLGLKGSTNVQYDPHTVGATYAAASATSSALRTMGHAPAEDLDVREDAVSAN